MGKGVIYVARGAGYLTLAQTSAASLRAQEPDLPIDLFTDQPAPAGPFDRVHPIPDSGTRDKIACMAASRFERTLFLDCDTLVLAPPGDLFDLCDRFDLAVAHDVRRLSALVREGHAVPAAPYAFPQFNTGVLLFRRTPAMAAFLADWGRRYAEAGKTRDQITFRDLIWQSDIRFHVLPEEFNLRRVTLLDAWEPLDARPTILHSHRLLQHLRRQGGRVTTLAEVLALERAARAAEWTALGQPADLPDGADPLPRIAAAEAMQDSPKA